jgi:hypothetical protein
MWVTENRCDMSYRFDLIAALKIAGVALIDGGRPIANGGTDSVNAGDSVVGQGN